MRIAIDGRLVAYRTGGIANYTVCLARALRRIDRDDELLLLVARRQRGRVVPGLDQRRLLTPPHHRLEQLALPLELSRLKLDLLHSPDFIPPFRRRCRAVITVHDLAFLRFPGTVTDDSRRYYGQLKRATQSADGIIAVSEATRRDLVELLDVPPQRVRVIHHATDEQFRPLPPDDVVAFRAWRGLPERFVLWVGTLEPRKNLTTLLRAYALLKEQSRLDGWPLIVVGERGWLYEDTLRLVEALRLTDEVRFIGPAPPQELAYLYNAARLFVFPSLYEGFGFPPLEAMACGTPVVAAHTSSLPEVLGEAALFVAPHDAEGFADAIERVLADEALWRELRQRGLAQAACYSWEKTATQTLALYREVAGR